MTMRKRIAALFLAVFLLLPALVRGADAADGQIDYGDSGNWAYFETDKERDVDVFLVCPTVDTKSERNALDLNDALKGSFLYALDLEKGIYEETGRLFSPYYRQMSINAYRLPAAEREQACALAYGDVSAAFRWYLDHENDGRGLILAGFSQGAEMCLELLKEYCGGDGAEAQALRERLISVYAIGWPVTEEMTETWPQIVPASGEIDTGTVVSFDCEDGSLTDTIIIPAGTTALSVNPLSWRTDGAAADRSLNLGAVLTTGAEPIPALCGAYIGARGELVVTDVSAADYPPVLDVFPEGAYHLYDYLFFFTNLKNNVADRTAAWRVGLPFKDVPAGAWYTNPVQRVFDAGLMRGTGGARFSPDAALRRAQLVTVLWRMAGEPTVNYALPFRDVAPDAWYTEAVRWAAAEGLSAGGPDGTYGPDAALTRGETADLLWRYERWAGADVSVGEDTNILSYSDAFDLPQAYIPALQWAVGAGVILGTGDGRLLPDAVLTRAQAAAMLSRLQTPSVTGKVIEIEKYGHARLDVSIEAFTRAGFALGDIVSVSAGSYAGDMPYFNGYYVDPGEYMVRAYPGQTNIAVCINYGKFAETAGVGVGDEVTLTLKEAGGALAVQEINNLEYTTERSDYASDAVFANFRPVVMGNIAPGRLYRSASPVNNEYGRAAYANAQIEAVGVNAVMNLANTPEDILPMFAAQDFRSDYYKSLYDAGRVVTLGMPIDFTSDGFAEGIARGLTFLSENDPPYLVHCTEGKDRAGFASMLLEALSGAGVEEIVTDYMTSYVNYYGLEPGTEKYDMIAEKNVLVMLRTVAGLEKDALLDGVDLQEAAENYLTAHGMTKEAVAALRSKLA